MIIKDNAVILFQGDSVTDCGRDRDDLSSLGSGYAYMAASWFNALYPEKNVRFINKGISGNRANDLLGRWQEDCISLKPDVISILIGINDVWRRYDRNDPTTAEQFENNYRNLLKSVKDKLPDTKIIIMEPFLLPCPPDRINWREDLDAKINVARKLSIEFGTMYISLDGIFAEKAAQRDMQYWAADGVHPTSAGHAVIAQQYLKKIGAICG